MGKISWAYVMSQVPSRNRPRDDKVNDAYSRMVKLMEIRARENVIEKTGNVTDSHLTEEDEGPFFCSLFVFIYVCFQGLFEKKTCLM